MLRWVGRLLAIVILLLVVAVLLLEWLPGSWKANQLATVTRRALDVDVRIADVNVQLLSATPGMQATGIRVMDEIGGSLLQVQSLEVTLSLSDLLRGRPSFERLRLKDSRLVLGQEPGTNRDWLSFVKAHWAIDHFPFTVLQRVSDLRIGELLVDSLVISDSSDSPSTRLDVQLDVAASTRDAEHRTRLELDGSISGAPVLVSADLPYLQYLLFGFPAEAPAQAVKVDAALSQSTMQLEASIGKPDVLQNLSARLSLNVPSVGDWQILWPSASAGRQPLLLEAELTRGRDDWLLRGVEGLWGQSDFAGDARIVTTTSPVSADVRLSSAMLRVADLTALATPESFSDDTLPVNLSQLLSYYPQLLGAAGSLSRHWQGRVSYRADAVESVVWPLSLIDMQADMSEQQLSVGFNQLALAEGLVEGSAELRFDDASTSSVWDLYLKRFDLSADASADEDPGRLAAHLVLRLAPLGENGAVTARDGQLLALAAGGDVVAALTGLAGMQAFPRLTDGVDASVEYAMQCSFAELQFLGDVVDITTLVFRNEDRVFLGEGSFAWRDAELDVLMESHASVWSPESDADAWVITGPVAEPLVEAASVVLTRGTASSVLSEIVSPAVSLMPYLGAGEEARYSPLCAGLANALQEQP